MVEDELDHVSQRVEISNQAQGAPILWRSSREHSKLERYDFLLIKENNITIVQKNRPISY